VTCTGARDEVARRADVAPGQIYRWRHELRAAATGFAEVVVAAGPEQRTLAGPAALEVELGRDIRVRIAATAPKELASAIIKALVAR
jgi:transposase